MQNVAPVRRAFGQMSSLHVEPSIFSLPAGDKIMRREWEKQVERAWNNTREEAPGQWLLGFWLGKGLLSGLLMRHYQVRAGISEVVS